MFSDATLKNFSEDGWQRFPVSSDGTEVYFAVRPNLVALEDLSYNPFASGAVNDIHKIELVVEEMKQLVVFFKKDANVHGSPWTIAFTSASQRQRAVEILESYLPKVCLYFLFCCFHLSSALCSLLLRGIVFSLQCPSVSAAIAHNK